MIVDIRGTNGAGKSTIIFDLMAHNPQELLYLDAAPGGKPCPVTHIGDPSDGKGITVVGKYLTQCGGCDGINQQDTITEVAREYHHIGGVCVIEGSIVGSVFERWAKLADYVGRENYWFCFLDTPLELCIERVKQRRLDAGNLKPFDPQKTLVPRYNTIERIKAKLTHSGYGVATLRHGSATADLMALLCQHCKGLEEIKYAE